MSKLGTYDAVTMLLGVADYREVEMRRVMTRWLYNWAREGKIKNYGDSKKAIWDSREMLDQYARYVGAYGCGGETRPEIPTDCT